jgi:hypothetical protein
MKSIENIDQGHLIREIRFSTKIERIIDWVALPPGIDKEYIMKVLKWEKEVLILVSTGTPIVNYEELYKKYHTDIARILKEIFVEHVNEFDSLWTWHHLYSKNLKTYAERRAFVHDLYAPLIKLINDSEEIKDYLTEYHPTGWEKIDQAVILMKETLDKAEHGIQHQDVGLHGREVLLTLAQIVYDKDKHVHPDKEPINKNQSGRMLEAYMHSFSDILTDEERAFAKATVNLSHNLTHTRDAKELSAELCYNAVISTIKIIYSINKYEKNLNQT